MIVEFFEKVVETEVFGNAKSRDVHGLPLNIKPQPMKNNYLKMPFKKMAGVFRYNY
jgi:hypothetical protein